MQQPLRVPPSAPARLVVLASGTGSLLSSLLNAAVGDYPARVVAVGVDRDCRAVEVAEAASLPTFTVRLGDHPNRDAWDAAITEATAAHAPDLIVSAGFMKILGPQFLSRFCGRILNTHPALLPAFPGAHGVAEALAYGVKVTGCTVHLVDAGTDTGPILAQQSVPVLDGDDEETLHERIKVAERQTVGGRGGRDRNPRRDLDRTKGDHRMSDRQTSQEEPIRRALISVYDKTGLIELAQGPARGGRRDRLDRINGENHCRQRDSGDTGGGADRLPRGARRPGQDTAPASARRAAGRSAQTRARRGARAARDRGVRTGRGRTCIRSARPSTPAPASTRCVEQIDIGGPSMVRAAAKNHPSVAVVTDPLGYDGVLAAVRNGGFTLAERKKLASLAFRHTAEYDIAVASWMESTLAPEHPPRPFPQWFGRSWRRSAMLRYGENPHQQAALYSDPTAWPGLAQAEQLHGKEMSYNNFTDADAAWRAAFDHEETCVAIIKHANPCGIAISSVSVADAHRKAHECDPLSAFGGVIAANTEVSVEMAEYVSDHLHRSDRRARLRRRRSGSAGAQEEHPGAGGLRAADRRHRAATRSAAGC